jgi:hypothetical protein
MTPRELERLEKDSIYTLRLTDELKDQIINTNLSELNRFIKTNLRTKDLVMIVLEKN